MLARTPARTDQQATDAGVAAQPGRIVQRERLVEDQVLRDKRANADETLREERAEHVALPLHDRL